MVRRLHDAGSKNKVAKEYRFAGPKETRPAFDRASDQRTSNSGNQFFD